eukprot:TRINITY_DN64860_c0_g1_i1.p2 TRINITY_DN64860_c0_g1~~TRINITY_DN64860_c0_g1_i1.p2  ORF type:complete len:109 (+),score=10.13 TRINITY_DN64860_c0_g1_i1:129-455(+)
MSLQTSDAFVRAAFAANMSAKDRRCRLALLLLLLLRLLLLILLRLLLPSARKHDVTDCTRSQRDWNAFTDERTVPEPTDSNANRWETIEKALLFHGAGCSSGSANVPV